MILKMNCSLSFRYSSRTFLEQATQLFITGRGILIIRSAVEYLDLKVRELPSQEVGQHTQISLLQLVYLIRGRCTLSQRVLQETHQ